MVGCFSLLGKAVSLPACGLGTSFSHHLYLRLHSVASSYGHLPSGVVSHYQVAALYALTGSSFFAEWCPGCLSCDCALMTLAVALCCLLSAIFHNASSIGLLQWCYCA